MTAEWIEGVRQTLDALKEWFPAAFGRARPLKIGIHADLLARAPAITEVELSPALGFYCRTARYLRALRDGGPRIDLDGNEIGEVTVDQAAGTKGAIERMKAKKAAALATVTVTVETATEAVIESSIEAPMPAPTPVPQPPTPKPPDPVDQAARLARYRRARGLGVRV